MTESHDVLAARWARAAERAPALALRQWLARGALAVLAIPGALLLANVAAWGWRGGHSGIIAVVAAHAFAVLLAIGLPVRHRHRDDRSGDAGDLVHSSGRLLRGYGDRADRLGALGCVMLLEVALLFIAPPVMTLVAGNRLQWPATFVVAVAASMVVWPLQRIAAGQRAEASRLSALER